MPYRVIQDALIAVLRKEPLFNLGVNVSASDYKILSSGFTQCIVLNPGIFTSEPSTVGGLRGYYWLDWEIRCELYVRYDGDAVSSDNIIKHREKIIELLARYPDLDGVENVLLATVRRGDQPIPVFRPDGTGPYFWLQNIFIHVREEYNPFELPVSESSSSGGGYSSGYSSGYSGGGP